MRAHFLMLLAMAGPALAEDADADALLLADKTQTTVERAGDWHVFAEAAFSESRQRNGAPTMRSQRLSLDAYFDKAFAPGWRAVFADRLDLNWQGRLADQSSVHTLKEAYLSWQATTDRIVDLGRINARYGVAAGYNPTDFFRAGAVRSVVSADPASLRRNRLGSVMLRGQTLWNGGSLTALYSPKLAEQPNNAEYSIDLGATNHQNRWLISGSQQLSDNLNPQWLLYSAEHESPQFGFNLTGLLNDATVAYVEWSGGRSRSLLSQTLNGADDSAFRNRLATGLTYTAATKLTMTLEYQYNGAALDQTGWDALGRGSLAAYRQYRQLTLNVQDLPTRQAMFLYGTWQDAALNHLDLTAMLRFDTVDHSRLSWLEARYHWTHTDLALQWQVNSGRAGSDYGALPQRQMWQAVVTYFF